MQSEILKSDKTLSFAELLEIFEPFESNKFRIEKQLYNFIKFVISFANFNAGFYPL